MDRVVTTGGVLAIVPARGGSKSIPRKNVRLLNGVPLLAYSIEAARMAQCVDRVIVSTDDEEIASVARAYGADVPFMRPAHLAEDHTHDLPVFEHALWWLRTYEGWAPDIVVQLRPTSPLRPPDCVDRAVDLLTAAPGADSVRGVVVATQNPFKMWQMAPDGAMAPLLRTAGPEAYNRPRQDLPVVHWQTGHVDAVRATTILAGHSMSGQHVKGLVIEQAYLCDIDTEVDWCRLEHLLNDFQLPAVWPRCPHQRLCGDARHGVDGGAGTRRAHLRTVSSNQRE